MLPLAGGLVGIALIAIGIEVGRALEKELPSMPVPVIRLGLLAGGLYLWYKIYIRMSEKLCKMPNATCTDCNGKGGD
jgi:hypothetical protein